MEINGGTDVFIPPVNNAGLWNTDQSNIIEGDIIAAVYETSRLDNDFLGYSEISGLANAVVIVVSFLFGLVVFSAPSDDALKSTTSRMGPKLA